MLNVEVKNHTISCTLYIIVIRFTRKKKKTLKKGEYFFFFLVFKVQ